MSITAIPWSSYLNPLGAIYQNAELVTLRNSGAVKEHVIYAIGYSKDHGRRFFRKAYRHPILLVSLVHLKHPFHINETCLSSIPKVKSLLENTIRSIAKVPFLVCFSVDCNDLIIFWSGDSLSQIMQYISSVSVKLHDYICEVFTIQACNKHILTSSKNKLLSSWARVEKTFESVNIYLQGPHHGDLIDKAHSIQKIYKGMPFCDRPKISILSGRDDVILRFEKIPITSFVQLYSEHAPFQIAQILNGLVSRTVIEIPLSYKSESTQSSHTLSKDTTPYYVPQLLSKFQTSYKKLNQTEQSQLIWAPPLCELLIELSNIQVSNTAYDIFAQAAESQKCFIDTLCSLLDCQKNRRILLDPDSRTVQLIQRYIQGWSQLSFHAMHAEWQLTQTSDVNRLYLFPAKLNRLYCAFMKQSGVLLSNNSSHEPPNSCYFLTPKLCSNAEFISIFRECDKTSSLILGEIPADLVFSPQILLPILIHEVGHYIGGTIRKRDDRYNYLLSSCMQFILQQTLNIDLLTSYTPDNCELIHYIIDEWKNILQGNNELLPETTYGIDATAHIKSCLIKSFYLDPGIPSTMANRFALSAITHNKQYQHLPKSMQVLEATKLVNNENYYALFNAGDKRSLNEFVEQLISIYREAFCDLCMIKTLNMKCGDYLNVICHSYRIKLPFGEREYEILSEMTFWERIISVIETIWCPSSSDSPKEYFDFLLDSSFCSKQDQVMIHTLLSTLYSHNQTDMPDTNTNIPNMYSRSCLKAYLHTVSEEIDHLIDAKEHDFELLRRIYHSLSRDYWIHSNSADKSFDSIFLDFQSLIKAAEQL